MGRKPKKTEKPQVNPELEGFNIQINEFGEIVSTFNIQKINTFLDGKVDDKKFRGIEVMKRVEDEPSEPATEGDTPPSGEGPER